MIYHHIKQSRKQKYLVSCLKLPQKSENFELMLSSQFQKYRGLFSLIISLRVKSLTPSVYVLPKFFHLARHTTVNMDTVSECQDFLNAELKKSSRLNIRKESLYHPILDGGVGLP